MQKESSQKYGNWHEEDEWRKDGGGAATECPGGVGDVAVVLEFNLYKSKNVKEEKLIKSGVG